MQERGGAVGNCNHTIEADRVSRIVAGFSRTLYAIRQTDS